VTGEFRTEGESRAAETATFGIDGIAEHARFLKSLDDARGN
jgi:hypothetical protein